MDDRVFTELQQLIRRESGIVLSEEKRPLLAARLGKRLRALQLNSPEEYCDLLKRDQTGKELIALLDVISTNVTHFFREIEHFYYLEKVFQSWRNAGKKEVRIWCAAASSGEEPYTIAIIATEIFKGTSIDWKILATDISISILERATRGEYEPQQLEKTPDQYRRQFFHPSGSLLRIDPALQERVLFKRLNLSVFPYKLQGPLDVIFCRNVMIYFDTGLRQRIVQEFSRLLAPEGVLFISKTESLVGLDHPFRSAGPSIFVRGGGR